MSAANDHLSPTEIKAIIASKRWTIANLAWRWNRSRETVSRILNSWTREKHWDDALRGLPKLSAAQSRALSQERLQMAPKLKRLRSARTELIAIFDLGAFLIATDNVGSIALEGDEGQVTDVMHSSKSIKYKINWPGGSDVFDQNEIEPLVADTGRIGFIRE